jgi:putative phosphoribosyl transferase
MNAASTVGVHAGEALLEGDLVVPDDARAVVLFAHGSGSSRHSPRNRQVAQTLNAAGFGTLLIDLLTREEERVDRVTAEHRFDIELLAVRLVAAIDWLKDGAAASRDVGLFGASTGAAGALVAAARRQDEVGAVVSRGGRPDLAGTSLARVRAPTLLLVGGEDHVVVGLNRRALELLSAEEKRLEIVPGASHLFEELGALEQVAAHAADWFSRHLGADA